MKQICIELTKIKKNLLEDENKKKIKTNVFEIFEE